MHICEAIADQVSEPLESLYTLFQDKKQFYKQFCHLMTPEMIQYFTQLSENRNRRLVYMRKLQSKGYFDVDQIRQRHPELWQEYLGSESESVWKKPFDRQMGLLDRIYFNLDESEPYLRVEMYKKWKSSKKSDLEASELESEREDLEKSLDEGDKEQTVEEQQPEDSPPEAEGEETLEELTQELVDLAKSLYLDGRDDLDYYTIDNDSDNDGSEFERQMEEDFFESE